MFKDFFIVVLLGVIIACGMQNQSLKAFKREAKAEIATLRDSKTKIAEYRVANSQAFFDCQEHCNNRIARSLGAILNKHCPHYQ